MNTSLRFLGLRFGLAMLLAGGGATLAQTVFLPFGSTWRYLATNTAPSGLWFSPVYNDTNWPSGVAKLGFGGDGETTRIGTATNGIPTYYFRRTFQVSNLASATNLVGYLVFDDGALVRVNGTEVFRSNLPPGSINYPVPALVPRELPDELIAVSFPIPRTALTLGTNLIAIEVHQHPLGFEDLGFDLELRREDSSSPPEVIVQPYSQVSPFYTNVNFVVAATGRPFYQWYKDTQIIPGAESPVLSLPSVTEHDVAVYRVQVMNAFGDALGGPAELQVEQTLEGPQLRGVIAADNAESLFPYEGHGRGVHGGPPTPTVYLSHGVPLFFTVKEANPDPGLLVCGLPSWHTKWVGYYSPGPDRLRLSTDGSDFNTVLGVYTNNNGALGLVGCDIGPPNANEAVVEFNATKRLYYIAVDGENGAVGTARLEIRSQFIQRLRSSRSSTNNTLSMEVVLRPGSTYTISGTNQISETHANWPQFLQFTTNAESVMPFSVQSRSNSFFIGVRRQ